LFSKIINLKFFKKERKIIIKIKIIIINI